MWVAGCWLHNRPGSQPTCCAGLRKAGGRPLLAAIWTTNNGLAADAPAARPGPGASALCATGSIVCSPYLYATTPSRHTAGSLHLRHNTPRAKHLQSHPQGEAPFHQAQATGDRPLRDIGVGALHTRPRELPSGAAVTSAFTDCRLRHSSASSLALKRTETHGCGRMKNLAQQARRGSLPSFVPNSHSHTHSVHICTQCVWLWELEYVGSMCSYQGLCWIRAP